jgi:hypothetical protein
MDYLTGALIFVTGMATGTLTVVVANSALKASDVKRALKANTEYLSEKTEVIRQMPRSKR